MTVLLDYIHVTSYLGKVAAAMYPGDTAAESQRAYAKKLCVLQGRAKTAAANIASVASSNRENPRNCHNDIADMYMAVTYLTNICDTRI